MHHTNGSDEHVDSPKLAGPRNPPDFDSDGIAESAFTNRRLSGAKADLLPLSDAYGSAIIPPPLPEVLLTTPGVEFSVNMFDGSFEDSSLPDQQRSALLRIPSSNNISAPKQIRGSKRLDFSETGINLDSETQLDEDGPRDMTLSNPPKNRHRVIAACIWGFCGGLSDGAPGALLPTIEAYYDISYAIVSMIWMASAVGFVIVAAFASQLDKYLGKTKSLLFGVLCQVVMYAMVSPGGPFELTVMGFFFVGTGLAVCLAQVNIFLSRMDNAATYLSYLHGGYGAGATVAPLISKSMVNAGIKWSYYYLILLGLAIFNLANFWLAFSGADEDLKPWDHHDGEKTEEIALTSGGPSRQLSVAAGVDRSTNELRMSRLSAENLEPVVKKESLMALAIKDIPTWLIALFVLFYQGGEVAMGGWVTTFLLESRSGNPETIEYVASGFWAGLTVGRLTLTHPFAKYLGGRRSVIIFLVGSIGFALLTWLVPNVIAASLFVSLCGVAIGPVYPLMITVATRHLPRKIQIVSLTIATAFGSSGGAIFPFLVGLISQFVGTYVVLPMFIGLFTACLGCWLLLPNIDRNVKSAWWHYIW